MPIRASVLRRPASNADTRFADRLGRRQRLGAARAGQSRPRARWPATDGPPSRPTARSHRQRVDVEDVGGIDDEVGPAAQARVGERGVHRADGEDRRDRETVEIEAIDRTGRAGPRPRPPTRPARRAASRSSAALEAGRPIGGRPRGIEPPDPLAAVAHGVEQARRGRPRSAGRGAASVGRAAGRRAAPGAGRARPAGPSRSARARGRSAGFVTCANAWRRWSATGRSRRPRAGRRRVVAHAPERLVALERHRLDVEPGPFGVEAGEIAQLDVERPASWARVAAAASGRSSWTGRGASWIGKVAKDVVLASASSRIARRRGLDEQQLARAETPAPDRVGRRERDRAGLGGHRDQSVAGDRERRRSQAVAVDHRADPAGRPRRRSPPGRPTVRGSRRSGAGAWRRAGAASDAARAPRGSRRGGPGSGPSRSSISSSSASSSESESEPSGESSGPAPTARRRSAFAPPIASSVRPRTCSRLPRTVLISPLWAIERNGWARPPDRVGVRRVALVEDRVGDGSATRAGPGKVAAAGRP